jgi:homoserine O-acetyltransferase/O-succinyltransferase
MLSRLLHTAGGDFDRALGAIKARTIIMHCAYDTYFPPVDSEYEASRIPGAECRVIPSIWGHMTLWNSVDRAFIDAGLADLLRD